MLVTDMENIVVSKLSLKSHLLNKKDVTLKLDKQIKRKEGETVICRHMLNNEEQ